MAEEKESPITGTVEEKEESPTPLNEFLFTWRIENATLLWQKTGEALKSPTFEVPWCPEIIFSLALYPNGIEGYEDYISYFLAREDQISTVKKLFKSEFYLLAFDGSKVNPEYTEGFLTMRKFGMFGCPRFMRCEILTDDKSTYLPDEILTVCCRLWCEVKPDTDGSSLTEIKVCSYKHFARTQIKKEIIAKQMVIDSIALNGQIGEIKSILQDCPIATFSASFGNISGYKSLTIDIGINKDDKIKMATFKLMLIDEKRRRIFWRNRYSWNDVTEFESIVLSPNFSKNSELYAPHEMFVEKFLFLVCQFTFTTGLVVQKKEKGDYNINLYRFMHRDLPSKRLCLSNFKDVKCPTLADALKDMYVDKLLYDVKIKTDSLYVTAHKIVLCSRSTKFEGLLKSQDMNTSPQVIQVDDDYQTMKKVVYFLYTDDISDINWQIATTLLRAAIKYDIGLMKHKCRRFIKASLEISNVIEILLLAKEHNDTELRALARNFIVENRTAVYSSEEWNKFRGSHADFAIEIMLPKFQSK